MASRKRKGPTFALFFQGDPRVEKRVYTVKHETLEPPRRWSFGSNARFARVRSRHTCGHSVAAVSGATAGPYSAATATLSTGVREVNNASDKGQELLLPHLRA